MAKSDSFIDSELRSIWRLAIRERWKSTKLRAELYKVTSIYYTKKSLQAELISKYSLDFEWFKDNIANKQDTNTYNNIFKENYQYFALQKEGLNQDIIKVFNNALDSDLSNKDIISNLEPVLGKWKKHAFTIVNTAQAQFDTLQFKITSEKAGIDKFRYSGPPPQRPLCKHYFQKVLTMTEINNISSRLGYDFFIWRGKWNCRHFWEAEI